jgi:hypothetical protein
MRGTILQRQLPAGKGGKKEEERAGREEGYVDKRRERAKEE